MLALLFCPCDRESLACRSPNGILSADLGVGLALPCGFLLYQRIFPWGAPCDPYRSGAGDGAADLYDGLCRLADPLASQRFGICLSCRGAGWRHRRHFEHDRHRLALPSGSPPLSLAQADPPPWLDRRITFGGTAGSGQCLCPLCLADHRAYFDPERIAKISRQWRRRSCCLRCFARHGAACRPVRPSLFGVLCRTFGGRAFGIPSQRGRCTLKTDLSAGVESDLALLHRRFGVALLLFRCLGRFDLSPAPSGNLYPLPCPLGGGDVSGYRYR